MHRSGIRMGAFALAATTIVGLTSGCGSIDEADSFEKSEIYASLNKDALTKKETDKKEEISVIEVQDVEVADGEFLASDIIVFNPYDSLINIQRGNPKKMYIMSCNKENESLDDAQYIDMFGTMIVYFSKTLGHLNFSDWQKNIWGLSKGFEDSNAPMISLNEFLNINGLSYLVQDRYTMEDIINIGSIFGCVERYSADDVYVLDSTLSKVCDESDVKPYYFLVDVKAIPDDEMNLEKAESQFFRDVNNAKASCRFKIDEGFYYCQDGLHISLKSFKNPHIPLYQSPLVRINVFLDRIGRSELKQDDYSWAEIQVLGKKIMEKGVALVREQGE